MSDGPLLNDVTRAFAEAHRNEDVRDLALKTKRTADLDLPAALDQIAGWQIARNKLPQWAACADIVYPAHISMEQCSSQFTAQYKVEIARRLLRSLPQSAGQTANDATMTDLTGGFGVDFSYLARGFGHATYVERQSHLCELAAHNMAALGLTQAQVVCGDGVEYLRAMEPAQLIYIDPARRDEHGARTYAIEDCTPDVLALREADCSIAVAEGSDASCQIAQVVLLDSDFTNLPQVVMEGRKVVNNVTRTASVFFIKTIYSVLVSVICLLANIPFPFIPIQITVLDAAIEGYPSFLTIWESDTRKIRGRFLKTALSNALPFALTVTAMVAVTSIIAPFTVEQRQTVMYFLLIFISMAAVVKSCIPFNGLRTFICITMVIGTFGGLAILPSLFEISAITAGMGKYLLAGGSLSVVCLLLLLGTRGVLGRKRLSEAEAVR